MANKGQKIQRRPERCIGGCNRLLVRRPEDVTDKEQQAVHYGKGLCNRCRYRKLRKSQPRQRTPMPEKCVSCEAKLHPRRQGWVTEVSKPYGGNGMCMPCWAKDDRAKTAQVEILMGVRKSFRPRNGGKTLRAKPSNSLYSGKVYG